jgi:putative oxidoreductase
MQSQPRHFIPALKPFYDAVSDLSYPFIRIAVAGAVLVHGTQKLMSGPAPVIANMAKLGYQPAAPIAYLIIFIETVGALCVIFGLFTRFFAAALCIESLVLTFGVKWGNGFAANHDGYEMLLIWAIVFFAIALRGSGPYSLDHKLGREL